MRRQIRVVGAMLEREGGQYLITQRRPEASLPLLWEFPGGRVEEHESEEAALARELREEMNISVNVHELAVHTKHGYENYDIDFFVFRCTLKAESPPVANKTVHNHAWVTLAQIGAYQFPDVDAKTLAKLLEL